VTKRVFEIKVKTENSIFVTRKDATFKYHFLFTSSNILLTILLFKILNSLLLMILDLKFSNMTDGFSNAIAYKCQINSFPLGGVAISHKIAVARPTLRIRNAGETNSRRKWVVDWWLRRGNSTWPTKL